MLTETLFQIPASGAHQVAQLPHCSSCQAGAEPFSCPHLEILNTNTSYNVFDEWKLRATTQTESNAIFKVEYE